LLLPARILAKARLSALTKINFSGVLGWELGDVG
jgi:hypothetical protein